MSGLEDNIEDSVFESLDSLTKEDFIDYDEQLHNLAFDVSNDFREYINDNCLPLLEHLDYSSFLDYLEQYIDKY
jgi:hypothetical protein